MFAIGYGNNWGPDLVREYVAENFEGKEIEDLTVEEYDEACNYIESGDA